MDGKSGPRTAALARDGRRQATTNHRWGDAHGRQTTHSTTHATQERGQGGDFFLLTSFFPQESCFAVRRKGFLPSPLQQPINKLFIPRDGTDACTWADSRPSPRIAGAPPLSQMGKLHVDHLITLTIITLKAKGENNSSYHVRTHNAQRPMWLSGLTDMLSS